MKEKYGKCTDFSPADNSPEGKIGVCYKDRSYLRMSADQSPKNVDSDGSTCFSPGKDRTIATQPSFPHTSWWALIKRHLIK